MVVVVVTTFPFWSIDVTTLSIEPGAVFIELGASETRSSLPPYAESGGVSALGPESPFSFRVENGRSHFDRFFSLSPILTCSVFWRTQGENDGFQVDNGT